MRAAVVSKKAAKIKMLVHCSAGAGRSGTFIALYQTMALLDKEVQKNIGAEQFQSVVGSTKIDLFNTVFNLRGRRAYMVRFCVIYRTQKCS